jgi:hypothetical protein
VRAIHRIILVLKYIRICYRKSALSRQKQAGPCARVTGWGMVGWVMAGLWQGYGVTVKWRR